MAAHSSYALNISRLDNTRSVKQVVSRVVSGSAFRSIYEAAIRDFHRTIFLGDTNTIAVRLTLVGRSRSDLPFLEASSLQ